MVIIMPLNRGLETLIDDEDADLVAPWKWYAIKPYEIWSVHGYMPTDPVTHIQPTCVLSRLIMNAPPGLIVDHWNRDGLDNRRQNLRLATYAQNRVNAKPQRRDIPKGVYSYSGRWLALFRSSTLCIRLGVFDTMDEAAEVYRQEAVKRWGEFVRFTE